jgi:hypothetical protein
MRSLLLISLVALMLDSAIGGVETGNRRGTGSKKYDTADRSPARKLINKLLAESHQARDYKLHRKLEGALDSNDSPDQISNDVSSKKANDEPASTGSSKLLAELAALLQTKVSKVTALKDGTACPGGSVTDLGSFGIILHGSSNDESGEADNGDTQEDEVDTAEEPSAEDQEDGKTINKKDNKNKESENSGLINRIFGNEKKSIKRNKRSVKGHGRDGKDNANVAVQCSQLIQVPNDKVSVVILSSGSSDCSNGELKFYNGADNASDENPFVVPCGSSTALAFEAEGNEVYFEYSYDSSQGHAGFILLWLGEDD